MKSHHEIDQETITHNDQYPLLREYWAEHDGTFSEFTPSMEIKLAGVALYEVVSPDEEYRKWIRRRAREE